MNITLKKIHTNNLQSIDANFPYGKMTAIVGNSGSGKSSLAFHTLYALCKNELDTISGLHAKYTPDVTDYASLLPAIALKQKNTNTNPRSTLYTYLHLDTLLLPLFLDANPNVKHNILAQNNPKNFCPHCQGLGVQYVPDISKIAVMDKPLQDNPFLSWNKFASKHYIPLLQKFCDTHSINMTKSLQELSSKERDLLLYHIQNGEHFEITYSPKKGRRKTTRFPFIGAIAEIQRDIQNMHEPGVLQKIKSYIKEDSCPVCHGARFSENMREYLLGEKSINDIMLMDFHDFKEFLVKMDGTNFSVRKLNAICKYIIDNNLGYLTPSRSVPSLSGGEFQRLQFSAILCSEFSNLLYVFDEVSSSLHILEYDNIISQLKFLMKRNATLVMVEHKLEFIEKADNIIALDRGKVVDSATWLHEQKNIIIDRKKIVSKKTMHCAVESINNIKKIAVDIPLNCLVGCCGFSGSGKSTFAESLASSTDVLYIKQGIIRGNSNSTVGTYTKIISLIDKFLHKHTGLPEKTFLFSSDASKCPACEGKGKVEYEAAYGLKYNILCEKCDGKRYNSETLAHKYQGMTIYDILSMPILKLLQEKLFSEDKVLSKKLKYLCDVGLGHLHLLRETSSLSGGEAQRIKLLSQIKGNMKNIFLIIDEPVSGLERTDTKRLLCFLEELLPSTKGIMVIEHNVFFLKAMDYILEFGPYGGNSGGSVIYNGFIHDIKSSKLSKIKNHLI